MLITFLYVTQIGCNPGKKKSTRTPSFTYPKECLLPSSVPWLLRMRGYVL